MIALIYRYLHFANPNRKGPRISTQGQPHKELPENFMKIKGTLMSVLPKRNMKVVGEGDLMAKPFKKIYPAVQSSFFFKQNSRRGQGAKGAPHSLDPSPPLPPPLRPLHPFTSFAPFTPPFRPPSPRFTPFILD